MHLRSSPFLRVLVASAAAVCCVGGSSALAQQTTTQLERVQSSAHALRPPRDNPNPGMGIRFLDLGTEDRERIVETFRTIA